MVYQLPALPDGVGRRCLVLDGRVHLPVRVVRDLVDVATEDGSAEDGSPENADPGTVNPEREHPAMEENTQGGMPGEPNRWEGGES